MGDLFNAGYGFLTNQMGNGMNALSSIWDMFGNNKNKDMSQPTNYAPASTPTEQNGGLLGLNPAKSGDANGLKDPNQTQAQPTGVVTYTPEYQSPVNYYGDTKGAGQQTLIQSRTGAGGSGSYGKLSASDLPAFQPDKINQFLTAMYANDPTGANQFGPSIPGMTSAVSQANLGLPSNMSQSDLQILAKYGRIPGKSSILPQANGAR